MSASRPMPATVAGEVLQRAVDAAAELARRGFPVTGPGVVSIVAGHHGLAAAEVVRDHLIAAGVYSSRAE